MPANPDPIEDVIRSTIEGQSARYTRKQDSTWKFYEGERRRPGLATRLFRFDWIYQGRTDDGLWGSTRVEVDWHCHIIVDYSVPEQVAAKIAGDDHFWLRDTISAVRTSVTGWRLFVPFDWDFTDFSTEDQAQVDHVFVVRYLQQRV